MERPDDRLHAGPADEGALRPGGGARSSGGGPRRRARLLWSAGVALLVAGILLYFATQTIADPDLWGHVRFGQLTLRLGGPARVDPFSYLSGGQEWINHEWLAEVLFAGLWGHFGAPGLVALKAGVTLLVLGLVYARLAASGLGALRGGVAVLLLAPPVLVGLGPVRPHMFTYLGFVVTLVCISAAEEGRTRCLWILPPLFAVWVNLHGGVLAGAGVVAVWAATHVASRLRRAVRSRGSDGTEAAAGSSGGPGLALVLGIAAAAAAALLLNPYGPELPAFLLRTATVPRPHISEWQSLRIQSPLGLWYMAYLGAGGWALWRSRSRPPAASLAILGVLAVLPLTAVRHLPLLCLTIGVLLAPQLAELFGPRRAGGVPKGLAAPWMGLVSGIVALGAALHSVPAFRCIEMGPERGLAYPARAVGLLERSGARGRLAVFFDWGEYSIWHLAPRLKVGMDGRRETVYPDSIYQGYLRWVGGVRDWDAFLARGPADLALVPRDRPVYNLMALDPEWPLVYQDSVAALFGRRDAPATGEVRRATAPDLPVDGQGLCFP